VASANKSSRHFFGRVLLLMNTMGFAARDQLRESYIVSFVARGTSPPRLFCRNWRTEWWKDSSDTTDVERKEIKLALTLTSLMPSDETMMKESTPATQFSRRQSTVNALVPERRGRRTEFRVEIIIIG
jgi:hypothetical protein